MKQSIGGEASLSSVPRQRGIVHRKGAWADWTEVQHTQRADVRFGSLADICSAKGHVRFTPNSDRKSGFPHKVMSALPPKRTCAVQLGMSAKGQKQTLVAVNLFVRRAA